MSERRFNRIELFKTLILVVLFFTTILFLYLLWSLDSANAFHLPSILSQEEEIDPPDMEAFLIPSSIIYSQGDGSYQLADEDLDQKFVAALAELRTLSNSASILVSEVTAQQYQEAMSGYQSIILSFDYGIPFSEVCSRYEIKRATGFDVIESMNTLSFSEAARESIFIYDKVKGKYFRLLADEESSVVKDEFSKLQKDEMLSYYTVGNILGGENPALIPLTMESDLIPVQYDKESPDTSEEIKQALAESLFGENFDFVRRITDSFGNVTYMYGYGQKTFSTSVDGVFEYKNETLEGDSTGFFSDLQTALTFVAMHGGWDGLDGQDAAFYLKDAQSIADGKKEGYRFSFAIELSGEEVFYESGFPIEIEVLAGQISYYKRDVFSVDDDYTASFRPAQDPANVIAQNYSYIYSNMNSNTFSVNEEEAFDAVASWIISVQTGFVRIQSDQILRPAWIIHMNNGQRFYFSLYEAKPIVQSKQ